MDKYLKLQCVKGLLMSLDEQLGMRFQKEGLSESTKLIITDKYYDAILEQLEEEENIKKKKFIIDLHKSGVITENQKQNLLIQLMRAIEPEKAKEDRSSDNCVININGVSHAFLEQTISWEQVVVLSNLALAGSEILTITYSHGESDKRQGTLDVNEIIKVKDRMIFNVANTTEA